MKTTTVIPVKITTIRWELVVVAALLLGVATPAYPQASAPHQISSNELAKQVANPVTSLWSIQFQFNNFALESGQVGGRPPLPACLASEPNEGCESHHAPGDPALRQCPSPNGYGRIRTNNHLWRHDPGRNTFAREFRAVASWSRTELHFPDGPFRLHRGGKWQLGPAAVVGYLTDKFLVGAFA